MPFILPYFGSMGLTQIKGRVKEIFKDRVDVHIHYLNHDFFRYFGGELYVKLFNYSREFGFSEWIFRPEAFDNIRNNYSDFPGKVPEAYFQEPGDRQFFAGHWLIITPTWIMFVPGPGWFHSPN